MKIVADENIPLLMECFGAMGEVVALPGRSISPEDVQDADALLVRSVTKVSRQLVENSSLKFVGTATAGFDHIDREYLASQGIAFHHAPGCNATAVVEYVLAALDILADRDRFELWDRKVGIIGKGEVGGRLYQLMESLGVEVCACDPLLESQAGNGDDSRYVSVDKLIECSDVICLHTPLTLDGPYPTHYLIGEQQLQAMKPGTVLINAGRGPVIDNAALKRCLYEREDLTVVLDVWEHEPDVDPELMARVDIATPHIAGYSLDGKIRGTEMVYKALCQHFGFPARVRLPAITPLPVLKQMKFNEGMTFSTTCSKAIRSVYDIRRDDAVMRKRLMGADKSQRKLKFDLLRKEYPERREFSTLRVELKNCTSELVHVFQALQFKIGDEL
ncbi:4-phosphoerythronate dehydrogenase PdxB [Endozoicomonas sp. SCSIO W0465]|uniref:4-phosphoerythronate dehydrogenase PdxB n=1 Tax=Endozoicomonas sp. SCSIO W0465 TaxID=2918516 RepID=UPI00207532F3|nr:4-phosphoerythronate dehydrogenase PdxB [Endozoicomonas sp. SCSIO W0465]USE34439.1 4-phosphoerythronate dehydrogenase PdxB [Endozoicomonas sp. SCSIO W0465]